MPSCTSPRVSASTFPISRVIARAICSLRSTSSWPTRCSTWPRTGAGVFDQRANPRCAEAIARCMSVGVERGNNPIRSFWSAGLRFSKYSPLVGAAHSPAMKFLKCSGIDCRSSVEGVNGPGPPAARGRAKWPTAWRRPPGAAGHPRRARGPTTSPRATPRGRGPAAASKKTGRSTPRPPLRSPPRSYRRSTAARSGGNRATPPCRAPAARPAPRGARCRPSRARAWARRQARPRARARRACGRWARSRGRDRRPAVSPAACPPLSSPSPSPSPSPCPCPPLCLPRQPVALDLLVQVAPRHLQCARRLGDVPVVLLELGEQVRPLGRLLELFEGSHPQPVRVAVELPAAGAGSAAQRTRPHEPLHIRLTHLRPRRQNQEALYRVAELADVPGPLVRLEALQGGGREAPRRQARPLGELIAKVLHQPRDVAGALAQRRDVDRDDVESVQQVLAEPPLPDFLVEVLVGRGDDAHVHRDRLPRSDPRSEERRVGKEGRSRWSPSDLKE